MARLGRPYSDNPKNHTFSVKIDQEMLRRLEAYCERHGIPKGEAVRQALTILFELEE